MLLMEALKSWLLIGRVNLILTNGLSFTFWSQPLWKRMKLSVRGPKRRLWLSEIEMAQNFEMSYRWKLNITPFETCPIKMEFTLEFLIENTPTVVIKKLFCAPNTNTIWVLIIIITNEIVIFHKPSQLGMRYKYLSILFDSKLHENEPLVLNCANSASQEVLGSGKLREIEKWFWRIWWYW